METDQIEIEVYETQSNDELSDPISSIYDEDESSPVSTSGDIVSSALSVKKAQETFQNASLDARHADFSDRITRRKTGYRALPDTTEFVLYNSRYFLRGVSSEPETRLQKLRRLIIEVNELEEDANAEANQNQQASGDTSVSYPEILDQVATLQSELSKISRSVGQNPGVPIDAAIPGSGTIQSHLNATKLLMSQLRSFKDRSSETQSLSPASSQNNDGIVYELYYTPESARQVSLSQTRELEARIATLERIIGVGALSDRSDYSEGVAAVMQSGGNLVGAVHRLDQHLSLLTQPRNLDAILKRVQSACHDLERLEDLRKKRDTFATSDDKLSSADPRIDKLYAALGSMDSLGGVLPQLIARLHALKSLHDEAASFSDSLSQLGSECIRIGDTVAGIDAAMVKLSANVKQNEETCLKNVESLDIRMQELAKRIDKLDSA